MKGKLIAFEGSDGSGKTTIIRAVGKELDQYLFNQRHMYFSSLKRRKAPLNRALELTGKLFTVHTHLILGRTVLTDRYIHLTFKDKPFLRKIVQSIFPTPSIVYVLKASPWMLRKRREVYEGIGDKRMLRKGPQLTEDQINDEYKEYESIPGARVIDTGRSRSKCVHQIVSDIKSLYNIP